MRSKYLFSLIAPLAALAPLYAQDAPAKNETPPPAVVASAPGSDEDPPGLWASFEYLNWWIRSGPVSAPLVTVGDPTDPIPGAIGQPGTRVLSGRHIDYG